MNKGGYQILDLKNKPLEINVGMVYEGSYDTLEGTRKPILVSGLNFEGKEYPDFWANFIVDGSTFLFSNDHELSLSIRVQDNDVITVNEL